MHPISEKLISWYKKNKRDLPWRNTNDPYKIWLSEIILQQTQVIQGTKYYLNFIDEFPKIELLAKASEDKVMRMWQGLGYYSRARNLIETAKNIHSNYNNKFPTTYEEIKKLKGIGEYTSSAISSIAFNLPYAVVDGNVYRVVSRLFNISTPINSTEGKKIFSQIAKELLNKKHPGLHNNAMMEFGAICCKPQNPKCEECPVSVFCLSYAQNTMLSLPVKTNKIKIKERYLNYFIFNYKDYVYIRKRIKKDIWQNLYEFYLIETDKKTSSAQILKHKELQLINTPFKVLAVTEAKKHILSHQHIFTVFYEISLDKHLPKSIDMIKVRRSMLNDFGFPQLLIKYLQTKNKHM